jgi:hypothetical protein
MSLEEGENNKRFYFYIIMRSTLFELYVL